MGVRWSQPLNLKDKPDEVFFLIAQALTYGYEFEKTPEDAVKDYFQYSKDSHEYAKHHGYAEQIDRYSSNMHAVKFVLTKLGIRIEGVNAKEKA